MKNDTNKDSKSNKPAQKKLSLDKETLRSLTTDELDQAQGGVSAGGDCRPTVFTISSDSAAC